MQAAAERLEFTPPPQRGVLRSLVLALLAHLLLLAALTWGVQWKREAENLSVEAELWSAVPQQAAPKAVETPPPPPPPPVQKEEVKPPPPPPAVKDADIALEREKKRRELEKQRALEEKLERDKKLAAEKKKEEQRQQEKEKARAEKERQEKKELEAKRKAEAEARREKEQKEAEAAKRQDAQRQENIRRMQGLAGANGEPNASGTAQRSSGPSASYAGRIRARVKPNIVFTDDVAGNPTAEVEVRTAPDGTIVGRRLLKSSGAKAWDESVLKAIDKTETLPRDTDGRVPPLMILEFRPKD